MVSFHVVISALADCAALLTPGAGLAPQPATSRRTHGLDLAGTIARPAVAANTSTVPSHAYAPGRTMQANAAGYVPASAWRGSVLIWIAGWEGKAEDCQEAETKPTKLKNYDTKMSQM